MLIANARKNALIRDKELDTLNSMLYCSVSSKSMAQTSRTLVLDIMHRLTAFDYQTLKNKFYDQKFRKPSWPMFESITIGQFYVKNHEDGNSRELYQTACDNWVN